MQSQLLGKTVKELFLSYSGLGSIFVLGKTIQQKVPLPCSEKAAIIFDYR
jgi:hypothetical protein